MFTRIVKMEFEPEKITDFLANFELVKERIRNFPGCTFLELYQDKSQTNVFFTYSKWESPKNLEAYRNSDLFAGVWAKTKIMFNAAPQAWSVDTIHHLG